MELSDNTICQLKIDGKPFSFPVDGVFFTEDSGVLFEKQGNIIEKNNLV